MRRVGQGRSFRDAKFDISLPGGWSWEHLLLALVLLGAIAWWALQPCGSSGSSG